MMSAGYRPRGFDHHSTVVRFTEGVFGKNQTIPIALFDQMRRKRNRAVYEVSGVVSKKEAERVSHSQIDLWKKFENAYQSN